MDDTDLLIDGLRVEYRHNHHPGMLHLVRLFAILSVVGLIGLALQPLL